MDGSRGALPKAGREYVDVELPWPLHQNNENKCMCVNGLRAFRIFTRDAELRTAGLDWLRSPLYSRFTYTDFVGFAWYSHTEGAKDSCHFWLNFTSSLLIPIQLGSEPVRFPQVTTHAPCVSIPFCLAHSATSAPARSCPTPVAPEQEKQQFPTGT